MPELWVPGAAGPSLEDFVVRLHKTIESFAARRGWDAAIVEVQLHDGTRFALHSIRPEPGYGFLTLCPYPEEQERPWPRDEGADGECPPEELATRPRARRSRSGSGVFRPSDPPFVGDGHRSLRPTLRL